MSASPVHELSTSGARVRDRRWLVLLVVWTVPALLATFETLVFWRMRGLTYPAWRALLAEAPGWYVYALLTPAIIALGRRLPVQGAHRVRNAAMHFVIAQVPGSLYALVAATAYVTFSPVPSRTTYATTALSWFLSALPLTTLAYFGIIGVGAALAHLEEVRRRETESARLSAQLAEARLGALQMQLHPHFLFNTLNAVTVLARDHDTDSVVEILTLLSELLRDVLRGDGAQEVSLDEELGFARRYLALERIRFADRMTVHERMDDAMLSLAVPRFILQPLIENALRHGIAPKAAGGSIEISARLVGDDTLEIVVADDGRGLPDEWRGRRDFGIGLENTAARLDVLHGPRARLDVTPDPSGGTRAAIRIPARQASARVSVPSREMPSAFAAR